MRHGLRHQRQQQRLRLAIVVGKTLPGVQHKTATGYARQKCAFRNHERRVRIWAKKFVEKLQCVARRSQHSRPGIRMILQMIEIKCCQISFANQHRVLRAGTKCNRARIPHQEHRQLHVGMFRRLENPFVIGLLEAYWEAYEAVELNVFSDYNYLERVWDFHARIVECICADQLDAGLALLVEHAQLLRDRV